MKKLLKSIIFSVALLANSQLSVQAQELMKGWLEIDGITSYYGNTGVSIYLEYQLEKKLVNEKYELVVDSPKNVVILTQKDAVQTRYDKYNGYNLFPIPISSATFGDNWEILTISFGGKFDFDPTDFTGTDIQGTLNLSGNAGQINTTYISKRDGNEYSQRTIINSVSNTDFANKNRGDIPIKKLNKIPEPSSTFSLLVLGTLGAGSVLKRTIKPKLTEKETNKVG